MIIDLRAMTWMLLRRVALALLLVAGVATAAVTLLPAQAATPAGIGCERVQYDARVLRVVDGDTVDFQVLLGFDVERYIRGRLYGVDTPEVYGAAKVAGKAASDFTRQWLAACGGAVLIAERGKDKYGRWLVMVDCRGQDLAAALVASKHAVEALY